MNNPIRVERYLGIKKKVIKHIEPILKRKGSFSKKIEDIDKTRKRIFPKTSHIPMSKGAHKFVFPIQSNKKRVVLKIAPTSEEIEEEKTLFLSVPKKHAASIYWTNGQLELQKAGEKTKIPRKIYIKKKALLKEYGIVDMHKGNFMKFGDEIKAVDGTRSKRK